MRSILRFVCLAAACELLLASTAAAQYGYAWGRNDKGQLGDGTTTFRPTPVPVTNLTGVVALAAGEFHSLALKDDGTVWAWGDNSLGELGDGTTMNRLSPVQVNGITDVIAISCTGPHSLALTRTGVVWAWGYNVV